MRKIILKIISFILLISLMAGVMRFEASSMLTAEATNIASVQEEIDRLQRELEEQYGKISDLEAEQDLILEKMEDFNAELINTMASIGLMENEIAEKESEIALKVEEIAEKQRQIVLTAAEYEEAKQQEETQRLNMAAQIRLLYEQGDDTYMTVLLSGDGLSDILNSMDYIEKMYEYSQLKLDSYIEMENQIKALWDLLEQEQAELEQEKVQLEQEQAALENQQADLQAQKTELAKMVDEMQRQSANYEAQIDRARQEAAVAQTLLEQNKDTLSQLQAAQAAQAAANATYTSNYDSVIDNAAGSDLGRKIAKFACQYIGNPYKAAGTSLTNGADCSGFTYAVYKNFGYTLPRTSYLQRSAGVGVSYEDAQPGDLICYEGHVALYIGGGLIVHASNSSPYPRGGIKISNAQYRTILAVRRIL